MKTAFQSLLISWLIFSFLPSLVFALGIIEDNETNSVRNGIGFLLGFITSIVIAIINHKWAKWKRIAFIPFSWIFVTVFGTLLVIPLAFLNLQPAEKYSLYGYVFANIIFYSYFIYLSILAKREKLEST